MPIYLWKKGEGGFLYALRRIVWFDDIVIEASIKDWVDKHLRSRLGDRHISIHKYQKYPRQRWDISWREKSHGMCGEEWGDTTLSLYVDMERNVNFPKYDLDSSLPLVPESIRGYDFKAATEERKRMNALSREEVVTHEDYLFWDGLVPNR